MGDALAFGGRDSARLGADEDRFKGTVNFIVQSPRNDWNNNLGVFGQEIHRPVHRMPVEVMQEIFTNCLPADQFMRPDVHKAPLLLTRVCLAWRRVVLSTPYLWNSLAIQFSIINWERRLPLMKFWVFHSSRHPVSLFAYIPMAHDKALDAFLQLFTSNLDRWKNLRLTLPNRSRVAILDALHKGTPLLQNLQLRFSPIDTEGNSTEPEKLVITGKSAPHIRGLVWSSSGSPRVDFLLSGIHLTDIDIAYPLSVLECLSIMECCSQLVRCDFRSVSEWAHGPSLISTFPSPFVLSELVVLSIQTSEPLGEFFQHVTLPALQVLKAADMGYDVDVGVWSQSHFNDFVVRSGCSLKRLHLLNVLPSEDDLIRTLQLASSSLVELRLLDLKGITVVMDRVLALLTAQQSADGQPSCTCPKLEVLKLGTSLFSTDGQLASMVESRWKWSESAELRSLQQVIRIRSINPRLDPQTHPEDIRRLTLLRKKGLEVL